MQFISIVRGILAFLMFHGVDAGFSKTFKILSRASHQDVIRGGSMGGRIL